MSSNNRRKYMITFTTIWFLSLAIYSLSSLIKIQPLAIVDNAATENLTRLRYYINLKNGSSTNDHIDDRLRLVILDSEDYENSYTLGYWTPRASLLKVIQNVIDQGASVALIDYELSSLVPIVQGSRPGGKKTVINENNLLFDELPALVQRARAEGCKLIFVTSPFDLSNNFKQLLDRSNVQSAAHQSIRSAYGSSASWVKFSSTSVHGERLEEPSAALLAYQHFIANHKFYEGQIVIKPNIEYTVVFSILPQRVHRDLYPHITWPVIKMKNQPEGSSFVWTASQLDGLPKGQKLFDNKLVIIGGDSGKVKDMHPSAFGQSLPGVYLLANGVNMLLTNNMPHTNGAPNHLVNIFLLGISVFIILFLRSKELSNWWFALLSGAIFLFFQILVAPIIYVKFNIILLVWLLPIVLTITFWIYDAASWCKQKFIKLPDGNI